MLAQGVLMGSVMGSQYFDKRRGAALGLVISGSSIGGVAIPIAISKMLNGSSLGFVWTVRIIGFMILCLLGFSCVVIKPRLQPRTTTFFIGAALKEGDFILLIISVFFLFLGMFTPIFFLPTYAVSRGMVCKAAAKQGILGRA
jgi:hypothetical protein